MAISSYNVVLKTSTTASGTYTKLVDIKDFPDLGSAPDTIEVTTLSDKVCKTLAVLSSLTTTLRMTSQRLRLWTTTPLTTLSWTSVTMVLAARVLSTLLVRFLLTFPALVLAQLWKLRLSSLAIPRSRPRNLLPLN